MLGMRRVDGFLFHPTVNNTLSALDDSKSMFSVAARDLIDSSGRTYMEYQRDKHGGRERLLEEFLTFGIWGFGVRAMKQAYDAAVLNMGKTGIKLPDLDIDMLPKAKKTGDAHLQRLNAGLVEKFAQQFPKTGQYDELLSIIKSPALQSVYRKSSIVKFVVASGVPALAIAFGVPTLNQWLTRQSLKREKAAKSQNLTQNLPQKPMMPQSPFGNMKAKAQGWPTPGQVAQPSAQHPVNPMGTMNTAQATTFTGAPAMGMLGSPFQQAPYPGVRPFQQPGAAHNKNGQVQFGGMADLASAVLQNERWNTLLIDGTISGGRVYKARNPMERFEIFFREAAIISFLYWIQRPLQDAIGKQMGKFWNIPADMEFKTIQYLRKHKDFAERPASFHQQYQQGLTDIADWMGKKLVPGKNGTSAKVVLSEILKNSENKEKALLDSIYDYFLKHRTTQKNMIFETAIDAGLIPTFNKQAGQEPFGQQMKNILTEMNPIKQQNLTENKYLDLTKKIDIKSIFSMMESLESLSEKTIQKPEQLEQMLKKTMRLRSGAWFASNAVCFTFLSIVIPAIQHYITFKKTGKNYFPGIQQEA